MMRFILLGASALLLAGCGGEEYPVPASEAFATLSSIGTPPELSPLPVGVHELDVSFQSVPADNSVKWQFRHSGDDIATITARVEPNGDQSSRITVDYAEGTAPDGKWHNCPVRNLLRRHVHQLFVEAVDARLEQRPFNTELRNSVTVTTAAASMRTMMKDIDSSMDAEIERRRPRERESARRVAQYQREMRNRPAANPSDAARPMTYLSRYR